MSKTITGLYGSSVGMLGISTPGAIEENFKSGKKMLMSIKGQMERLEEEGGVGVENQMEIALLDSLNEELEKFSKLINEIDKYVERQKHDPKYRNWKVLLQRFVDDYRHFKDVVTKHNHALQRETLLKRESMKRLYANESSAELDSLYRTNRSLDYANEAAQTTIKMGMAISGALDEHNEIIKSIHRRILDVGNTLGLSKSLMKMIDNRQFVDKLITYGGMIFILLVIFLVWYFYKK